MPVAPVSRNSPCPCGSGKRYKDCHGALAAVGGTAGGNSPALSLAVQTARSRYRAPHPEWSQVSPGEHDVLGALMEDALALQQDGHLAEAATKYRKVLTAAPDTHDALHMLGVIEYGLRNFDTALDLILRATKLRPNYEAIDRNLDLVRVAIMEQKRAYDEQFGERALPALCELINSRERRIQPRSAGEGNARALHLIGRATAPGEDDAWTLAQLAELFRPLAPTLWATDVDSPFAAVPERWAVVDYSTGKYPRGGTQVFVGIDFVVDEWIRHSNPERMVVVCNRGRPSAFIRQLRVMTADGLRPIEPVFMSEARAQRFGLGHRVVPIPRTQRDDAQNAPPLTSFRGSGAKSSPWLVGMIGQISDQVEEPEDVNVLSDVAAAAGSLALFDPGRYRFLLGSSQAIKFIARSEQTLQEFISTIECLYCRPASWWDEGLGREIFMAMACGKPVLCPRRSVHASIFADRVDGLLYDNHEESLTLLSKLRQSPLWAEQIANAAREKMRRLDSEAADLSRYEAVIGELVNFATAVSDA
jgi:hypothetical protein